MWEALCGTPDGGDKFAGFTSFCYFIENLAEPDELLFGTIVLQERNRGINILKEGDLVFFITSSDGHVSHVGIYLKDNKFNEDDQNLIRYIEATHVKIRNISKLNTLMLTNGVGANNAYTNTFVYSEYRFTISNPSILL